LSISLSGRNNSLSQEIMARFALCQDILDSEMCELLKNLAIVLVLFVFVALVVGTAFWLADHYMYHQ
ncbi:hypothetical protein KDA11_00770, partial [Candidatus Saccharibacteria bacterium]|nr:hypothetical protein [Candidatus Saccharibacteria bacterium]